VAVKSNSVLRGHTTNDLAVLLRVSADKVRTWIKRGHLVAVNTADPGDRPRYVVTPDSLHDFLRTRDAASPPKAKRWRRPQTGPVDYFPN
jgi:hypothetical protein